MSNSRIYQPSELAYCPHCGETEDEKAEDYTIPGRIGHASRAVSDCGWCEGKFSAERNADTTITITKE